MKLDELHLGIDEKIEFQQDVIYMLDNVSIIQIWLGKW